MIRTAVIVASVSLLFSRTLVFPIFAQSPLIHVHADERHNVHVVSGGRDTVIAPDEDQVGIDAIKVFDHKPIAGWLVLYKNPDGGSPIAGKLIVWGDGLWRDGRIVRSFPSDQVFWSWSFEHRAEQVAFHVGPAHGETLSHCELHDVKTGRLLSSWNGDLENPDRPAWTKHLNH